MARENYTKSNKNNILKMLNSAKQLEEIKEPIGEGVDSLDKDDVEALDKDIAIYTMPESFRFANVKAKSANKAGLAIIIGGGLFLLALAVGIYFLFFNDSSKAAKKETPKIPASEEQPAAKQPEAPAAKIAESPREAYLRLKKDFISEPGASSLEPTISDIGEITEETSGNQSVLKVLSKDGSKSGLVNMTLDGGVWKLSDENWTTITKEEPVTSTPETVMPEQDVLKPGIDSDADGLTDKEEIALTSDPNLADSDGDTYPDFVEFEKLFNPAGTGKLTDNKNIKKYENATFGYDFLYPSSWNLSTVGSDESVVIKSEDNQFIQVIVQPNADKETVEAWYKKQFNETEISSDKLVNNVFWDGVKSKDSLIIYLTDKKHNFIFTVTYNPGSSATLDYMNLFNLAVKTFEIK